MKKHIYLFLLVLTILLITSCSTTIIPKGYKDVENYSNQNIEQLNNTLQYSIYIYDETPNIKNNRFLAPVNEETKNLLSVYLVDFETEIANYDFANKYEIVKDNICEKDYAYIDYRDDDQKTYFMIYLLDKSDNKLYYCYLMRLKK